MSCEFVFWLQRAHSITLHAFWVRSYDVRLLCHPLNKRIHPTKCIHPNYNRLCSVLYQLNPLGLLRLNGDGLCPYHHLLNKVCKMSMLNFSIAHLSILCSAQHKFDKVHRCKYFEFIYQNNYMCFCVRACIFICVSVCLRRSQWVEVHITNIFFFCL